MVFPLTSIRGSLHKAVPRAAITGIHVRSLKVNAPRGKGSVNLGPRMARKAAKVACSVSMARTGGMLEAPVLDAGCKALRHRCQRLVGRVGLVQQAQ